MFVMVLKKLGDHFNLHQRKSHCLNCNELHCNAKYIYIYTKKTKFYLFPCLTCWKKLSNENKVATEYNSAFLTCIHESPTTCIVLFVSLCDKNCLLKMQCNALHSNWVNIQSSQPNICIKQKRRIDTFLARILFIRL